MQEDDAVVRNKGLHFGLPVAGGDSLVMVTIHYADRLQLSAVAQMAWFLDALNVMIKGPLTFIHA